MSLSGRIFQFFAVLLFLFYNGYQLNSQNLDSLERSLAGEDISQIRRIDLLNQASLFYTMTDSKKALETINKALNLATAIKYEKGLADAYRNLSIVYFYYDASYSISMEYLQRALDIFQNLNDSVGIANCYISLGHAFRNVNDRKRELEYHYKSYEMFRRMNNTERIGVAALNLGETFLLSNDFQKCRQYLDYAIRINDSINKRTTLSTCYKAMGMLEFRLGNYTSAEEQFRKALYISENLGENSQKIATIESMTGLAMIYKVTGNSKLQLEYLKKASEFSLKSNLVSYIQNIYTELMLFYSFADDQSAVKKTVSEFRNVSETIGLNQNTDRLNQINSIIQVHELEKSMQKLEERNLVQNERLRIRNMILIAGTISLTVLILLLISILLKNRKITEVNKILKQQREIIENQTRHLEDLNNTKDKFFSIVAHDLRSPLVSLRQFSDLLIFDLENIDKEELKTMGINLQNLLDNSIRMTDNLLTWARLQMKDYEIRPERINLKEQISDIYEFYREIAERKGIKLINLLDDNLKISGDRNHLAFIFRNLINNAIKFTQPGGNVILSSEQTPGNGVTISVSDNGIGISDDLCKRLFFTGRNQSTTGTGGEKGTGLGLILTYEFVKLNDGIIEVESAVGKGTNFRLRFKN